MSFAFGRSYATEQTKKDFVSPILMKEQGRNEVKIKKKALAFMWEKDCIGKYNIKWSNGVCDDALSIVVTEAKDNRLKEGILKKIC